MWERHGMIRWGLCVLLVQRVIMDLGGQQQRITGHAVPHKSAGVEEKCASGCAQRPTIYPLFSPPVTDWGLL
ncbi:Hypothetical protein NTJ_07026 [Nesidiocoris tenuis]|nr:Hypothetical protein NTJ_07026 [Nesidiocoris tenuis]